MKKRIITTLLVTVLGLSSSITAFAAPKTMPDGNVFDAEYYANTYADVKEALGTDEAVLYKHYLDYGKKEGRKPVADNEQSLNQNGTVNQTNQTSPVAGATMIDFYETWGAAAKTYRVEKYSNGVWLSVAVEGWEGCDSKYWILRTDFSDGLLDADGNGIDDRDPYNDCGYTDLNHNCMADGAPSKEMFIGESEHTPFWTCDHGVINGTYICQHEDCKSFRAWMSTVRCY